MFVCSTRAVFLAFCVDLVKNRRVFRIFSSQDCLLVSSRRILEAFLAHIFCCTILSSARV